VNHFFLNVISEVVRFAGRDQSAVLRMGELLKQFDGSTRNIIPCQS
jgi:hypothetical protein